MRLQKFLAEAGVGSRRKCETLILEEKVKVNGVTAHPGQRVDPETDIVEVNGKKVVPAALPHLYLLLNKPDGYLSTVSDPFNRRTILSLVNVKERIYPVGRLDKDSQGLILLTNDGELAHRLTHPKFGIEKVYEVWVRGAPSEEKLERLRRGVMLEDGMTSPCTVRVKTISGGKEKCLLEIKLHEGRKREIRRMMKKVGHPVLSLCRVAIGPLKITGIAPGKSRELSREEIQKLKRLVDRDV